jgi:hypothetical protein
MKKRQDELKVWEDELIGEQEKLARDLEPLLTRREELRMKLDLVQRLKNLESGDKTQEGQPTLAMPPIASPSSSVGSELQAAVRRILESRRKPMHVREIRGVLTEQGIPIPGKGTDANLIVHLRRAPTIFEPCGRGTYGLADWKKERARTAK